MPGRQLELQMLNEELERIRKDFLRIADECHSLIATGVEPEMSQELDRLNRQRKDVGARYRAVTARIQELQKLEASAA